MNTPSPLVPQGTLDRPSKGKSTVRIAIFTIISIHAVFFAGLLMQGCRRDEAKPTAKNTDSATNLNSLPALDAGYYSATQDIAQASSQSSAATNITTAFISDPIPNLPQAVTPEPLVPDGKSYTVVKGDTLTRIAKANGVSVGAITKANQHVDLGKLKPGLKIQIPAATATATAAAPSTASTAMGFKEPAPATGTSSSSKVYVVKSGETLTRIAKQHGTTTKALRAANNLKSDKVYAGQKLKMPAHTGAPVEATKTAALSKTHTTNPVQANALSSSGAPTNLH